jgi:hypothetical protein
LTNVKENITPDDKNWTWVLERKCADCGFDASIFDSTRTAHALRDQVVRWASVFKREDVRARPQSDVWSPLEYGCHVRDVFRKFDERLKLMLETIDPAFENWDQDATAIEDRYDLQNRETVAQELSEAGLSLATRFDSVNQDQWRRRGFRSDGSVFTVDSIAKYLMHDPVHHLWDVGAEVPIF